MKTIRFRYTVVLTAAALLFAAPASARWHQNSSLPGEEDNTGTLVLTGVVTGLVLVGVAFLVAAMVGRAKRGPDTASPSAEGPSAPQESPARNWASPDEQSGAAPAAPAPAPAPAPQPESSALDSAPGAVLAADARFFAEPGRLRRLGLALPDPGAELRTALRRAPPLVRPEATPAARVALKAVGAFTF